MRARATTYEHTNRPSSAGKRPPSVPRERPPSGSSQAQTSTHARDKAAGQHSTRIGAEREREQAAGGVGDVAYVTAAALKMGPGKHHFVVCCVCACACGVLCVVCGARQRASMHVYIAAGPSPVRWASLHAAGARRLYLFAAEQRRLHDGVTLCRPCCCSEGYSHSARSAPRRRRREGSGCC